jgi:phage terminase large subunit-like protein
VAAKKIVDPFASAWEPMFPTNGPRVAGFIEAYCTHAKGEWFGKPLILEAWQRWLLNLIFEVEPDTGLRKWRDILLVIPRKNAKSTIIATLGYYGLFFDGEGGPEVYSAAWGEQQARNVFDAARTMHDASPMLRKYTQKFAKAITCPSNAGSWKVVSRIAETQQGTNPHFSLIDEYHVHKKSDLYEAFKRGTQARRQPLLVTITTESESKYTPLGLRQDDFLKTGNVEMLSPYLMVARHERSRSLMIRFGVPWDSKDVDLENPEVIRGCNPAGWLDPQRIIDEYLHTPGSTVSDFKRFHLNMLVEDDGGEGIPPDLLADCIDQDAPPLEPGQEVIIGVDAGYRKDCSAVIVAGLLPDGRARFDAKIWRPAREQGLELDLEATVETYVNEMLEKYRVKRIVGDPALLVSQFQRWQRRLGANILKEYRFQWGDTGPDSVTLLAAIQSKRFVYNGDTEYTRHLLNMRARYGPNGAWRWDDHPDKKREDSDVPNDAGIASMMVAGELLSDDGGGSQYGARGLLIV